MKSFNASFILVLFSLLITACSTTQHAYIRNFEMYFESNEDIKLTAESVRDSAADLIYVQIGKRAQITMALAFIENGEYKWVSQDGVMFITKNGRLVRTVGLDRNLLYSSNLANDPLNLPSSYKQTVKWDRVIDTEFGEYGVKLSSDTSIIINQSIIIQNSALITKKYSEKVKYNSAKDGKRKWQNSFWIHQSSGQLLKSSQKISLYGETVEIAYISRAARLMEK